MPIESVNPANDTVLRVWSEMSEADLDVTLMAASQAQEFWASLPFEERALPLQALSEQFEQREAELAHLMAQEMGKPLPQGRAEVLKCASACRWVSENAADCLVDDFVDLDGERVLLTYRPLGLVLAVMPWNFPFWQVIRCLAPASMAGNGMLLKHAPSVQGCAEAMAEMTRDAGLPEGLFANLTLDEDRVGRLVARPEVAAVSLTGSTRAGSTVAAAAGDALKKCVLELGGSDPYVVLEDADIDLAVQCCAKSRLQNSGQSCIAAKRFIVVDAVRKDFTARLVAFMESQSWGDPLGADPVDIGPLARRDLRDALHEQVRKSVLSGARLLLGGKVPDGPGAYYPPTVLAGVQPGMPAFDEETFGPVAAVVPAVDEEHAFGLANATPFGLGAAIFTADAERGARLAADHFQVGNCAVNTMVMSDPRIPFGGIKASGFGRELGANGFREFTNLKTVRFPAV